MQEKEIKKNQSDDGFYTTFIKENETVTIDCGVAVKLKKVKPNGFIILVQAPKNMTIKKLKEND